MIVIRALLYAALVRVGRRKTAPRPGDPWENIGQLEIAKILGCKPETVGNWRGRRGLVSNRPPTKAKKKVQA